MIFRYNKLYNCSFYTDNLIIYRLLSNTFRLYIKILDTLWFKLFYIIFYLV